MTTTPTDPIVEMLINGVWTDITTKTRDSSAHSGGGIDITRGRPNEGAIAEPTQVDLTLNNAGGYFSPNNPLSVNYGLIGRNTPVRVGLNKMVDTFGRTLGSQWGSFTKTVLDNWGGTFFTKTANWITNGTAAAFNVTPGAATIQSAAATFRSVSFGAYGDCEILVKIKVSDRTSEFGVVLRHNGTERYSMYVAPGGTDQLRLGKVDTGVTLSYAANIPTIVINTWYWIKVQCHSERIQGKIWADGGSEPAAWNVRTWEQGLARGQETPATIGRVGIQCENGTALVTVGSFTVVQWRAHAEISKLPQRWDLSRRDHWVPVKARGMLQRLGQGQKAFDSAVFRHLSSYANVPMWYPLEKSETTRASSALPGGQQAVIKNLSFGEAADLPGVSGVATFSEDDSALVAAIPRFVVPGSWTLLWFYQQGQPASDTRIIEFTTTGSAQKWRITHQLDNGVRVDAISSDNVVIDTQVALLMGFADIPTGSWVAMTLYVFSSGGNVNWALNYHRPGGAGFYTTGTQVYAGNIGTPRSATVRSSAAHVAAGNMKLSHLFAYAGDLPFVTFNFAAAANAYIGETSRERFIRLTAEQDIKSNVYGQTVPVQAMGPQRPRQFVELLEECAETEDGILLEARGELGLELRLHDTLRNQRPLDLNVDSGHLTSPLDPSDDDQGTRNDVTVVGVLEGSARSVQETGPLNIQDPTVDPVDGVGIYDESKEMSVELASQLPPAANWRRSIGTQADPRYPSMTLSLEDAVYQADASLAAWALSLDSGDLVSLTNSEVSADASEQMVQSYTENIDVYEHELTLVTTPASTYRVGVVDRTTRVDTTYSVTQAAFTSGTHTSLSVQRTDATKGRWVRAADHAASLPFDIMVAGVRLRVTAVTGTTDPQAMTVNLAPVNGVIKVIPIGSSVRLATPWRVAR